VAQIVGVFVAHWRGHGRGWPSQVAAGSGPPSGGVLVAQIVGVFVAHWREMEEDGPHRWRRGRALRLALGPADEAGAEAGR